jgi:hypothetical protein
LARNARDETSLSAKELLDENAKLKAHISNLEAKASFFAAEKGKLEQQLSQMEAESRRTLQQLVDVEMQNSNVANLYVASFRLHATLDRNEVLAAIREIVINLIGSEELAVFEVDGAETTLRLASSFGVDETRWRTVAFGKGIIGGAAERGAIFVASRDVAREERAPGEEHLTACIPLVLGGKVTGLVAVFRMLEHKRGLEDVDHELFGLLGQQAAVALHCTALAARLDAAGLADA